MISIDKRVAKAALKLTKNYSDILIESSDSKYLLLCDGSLNPIRQVELKVKPQDVTPSIKRLMDSGYFKIHRRYQYGFSFHVTDRLVLRRAFWLDSFTHKFVGGFLAGLITGVLATAFGGLLLSFLQAWLGI